MNRELQTRLEKELDVLPQGNYVGAHIRSATKMREKGESIHAIVLTAMLAGDPGRAAEAAHHLGETSVSRIAWLLKKSGQAIKSNPKYSKIAEEQNPELLALLNSKRGVKTAIAIGLRQINCNPAQIGFAGLKLGLNKAEYGRLQAMAGFSPIASTQWHAYYRTRFGVTKKEWF